MSKVMPPQVAVIVLNWNGKEDTLLCLESLKYQDVECEIILIDNGSTDDSVAVVRDRFSDVVILETGANLGYTGGNNVGLKYTLDKHFDYVFVLNNDTKLDPNCISLLLAEMQSHSTAAAAAPRSFSSANPEAVEFAGGHISSDGITLSVNGISDSIPYDTEWLTGCAIFFRCSALEQVGLFETAYFLLFEDVDWSLRARRAGYCLRIVPQARLWHKVSASFGRTWSSTYLYYHTRNSLLWIERNFALRRKPRLYYVAFRRTVGNLLLREQNLSFKEKNAVRRAVLSGIIDYFLRRFGPREHSR